MRSWNSWFSRLRWAVASLTDLSSSTMPAFRTLISSSSWAMAAFRSSTEASRSPAVRERPLTLSSVVSICLLQYSRLPSSSTCSCFSSETMSSIILMTLEKSTFWPLRANATKRASGPSEPARPEAADAFCSIWSARRVACRAPALSCTKLGLGSAFLKRSRASSLFRMAMVSRIATSSSPRSFTRSSRSACLPSQSWFRSFRNFWSSISAASLLLRSFFICTTSSCSSPTRAVFFSMEAPSVFTSLSFAASRSWNRATASLSLFSTPARSSSKLAFISLSMPTTSVPLGTYPSELPEERKARTACLSSSVIPASPAAAAARRSDATAAAPSCTRPVVPAMPFSIAGMAAARAATWPFSSEDSFAYPSCSFCRRAVASATAALAASRSPWCCFSSCFSLATALSDSSMSDCSCGTLVVLAAMLARRLPAPFLQ
mmetsp:Transcript_9868/g.29162  ORF Transcript_9868/g.29162 Transcript_9868/m.29162 type:complete len:433 (+) Transcript_9868:117-1415(+)